MRHIWGCPWSKLVKQWLMIGILNQLIMRNNLFFFHEPLRAISQGNCLGLLSDIHFSSTFGHIFVVELFSLKISWNAIYGIAGFSVLGVTWTFRNHSNMRICCSWNIFFIIIIIIIKVENNCALLIFLWKPWYIFFRILYILKSTMSVKHYKCLNRHFLANAF